MRGQKFNLSKYVLPAVIGDFSALLFYRSGEESGAYSPERNVRVIERPIPENHLEKKLRLKPVLPPYIPKNAPEENEEEKPKDEWYKPLLDEVKYSNGPTRFAGELYDNGVVRVLEREGDQINSAEGLATFYSRREGFKKTATGAPFNDNELTVAVNERLGYQLPCLVKITNLENGNSVEAVANDHGPYMFNKGGKAIKRKRKYIPHEERIVDASPEVAKELDFFKDGKARVRIDYIKQL